MFDQALNTSVCMTITIVLFLLCTLFLVWYNQNIDATSAQKNYNSWVSSVKVIFLSGGISNLLGNGRLGVGSDC